MLRRSEGLLFHALPLRYIFSIKLEQVTYLNLASFTLSIGLQLPEIERSMKEAEQTLLTPLLSLDTPGKATVQVVILADPVSLY